MSNSLNDGLSLPSQFADSSVSGTYIGSQAISPAKIKADAVTYDKMAYGQVITGSPSAAGNIIQFGGDTGTAGSLLTVTFGTAFKSTPNVIMQATASGAPVLVTGSVSTTKFTAQCVGGSETINWAALGSGTF